MAYKSTYYTTFYATKKNGPFNKINSIETSNECDQKKTEYTRVTSSAEKYTSLRDV